MAVVHLNKRGTVEMFGDEGTCGVLSMVKDKIEDVMLENSQKNDDQKLSFVKNTGSSSKQSKHVTDEPEKWNETTDNSLKDNQPANCGEDNQTRSGSCCLHGGLGEKPKKQKNKKGEPRRTSPKPAPALAVLFPRNLGTQPGPEVKKRKEGAVKKVSLWDFLFLGKATYFENILGKATNVPLCRAMPWRSWRPSQRSDRPLRTEGRSAAIFHPSDWLNIFHKMVAILHPSDWPTTRCTLLSRPIRRLRSIFQDGGRSNT